MKLIDEFISSINYVWATQEIEKNMKISQNKQNHENPNQILEWSIVWNRYLPSQWFWDGTQPRWSKIHEG